MSTSAATSSLGPPPGPRAPPPPPRRPRGRPPPPPRDVVIPAMESLRGAVDAMEQVVGHDYWPFPSYNTMLFYV